MIDHTTQSNPQSVPAPKPIPPDPWAEEPSNWVKPTSNSRPLDLNLQSKGLHLPPPDRVLSPEGDPETLQIPAHISRSEIDPADVLLEEELKVSATGAKCLWDRIRDGLALLWWKGPQDQQPE